MLYPVLIFRVVGFGEVLISLHVSFLVDFDGFVGITFIASRNYIALVLL